jgi:hypothetical protein
MATGLGTVTTTTATLAARQHSIPISILPPTLRDACLVCRALDIQYIWIDALCIIQDDSDDWCREAQLMGPIYQHAVITIAAVAASSTREGFLSCPLRQTSLSTLLPIQDPGLGIDDVVRLRYLPLAERTNIGHRGRYHGTFDTDVEHSSWNSRGWTFQERQLASRILFFGQRGLHYECRSFRRSEDFPAVIRRDFRWYRLLHSGETHWRRYCSMWASLVEEYSTREFTLYKDKLPAISSLANVFRESLAPMQSVLGQRFVYSAGMWSPNFAEDLLWRTRDPEPRSRRIDGVPTWSWLSVKGPISAAASWIKFGEVAWTILHSPMEPHLPARRKRRGLQPPLPQSVSSGAILMKGLLGKLQFSLHASTMSACLSSNHTIVLAIPTWDEGNRNFLPPNEPAPLPRIRLFLDSDVSDFLAVDSTRNRFEWSTHLALGMYSWRDDLVCGLVLKQRHQNCRVGCLDGGDSGAKSRDFERIGAFLIEARGEFRLDYQVEVIQKFGFEKAEFEIW